MIDSEATNTAETIKLTADLAAAYLSNNQVQPASLPNLIASVHRALSTLGEPKVTESEKPTPPVSIKKSVTPDYLISLEDEKPYKSLRRHLTSRGLTPAEYRDKWSLPSSYPM